MDTNTALEIFSEIKRYYDGIKPPKYRNADLDRVKEEYSRLRNLKQLLESDSDYLKLVNAISQVISRLDRRQMLAQSGADTWSNLSERGMNKVIPAVHRRKGVELPMEWTDKWGNTCSLNNGYWRVKNYRVMDALGYMLLLKEGGNRLPEDSVPIFEDLYDIQIRESELNGDLESDQTLNMNFGKLQRHSYSIGFSDRDFRNNTGLKLNSADILALLLETSRVEFKVSFPVRLRSTGNRMNFHRMNFYSRFFELAEEKVKVRKDGIVQQRRYRVFFNTLLGELFVNNLLAKFNDRIGLEFYALPDSAQLFYRRMLLHNSFSPIEFKLETIAEAAGLKDSNRTNLINTIERNIFEPLKDRGYIASFKRSEGLDGTRYIIKRASDKSSKPTSGDGGSVK
jgi:hypothetical protein